MLLRKLRKVLWCLICFILISSELSEAIWWALGHQEPMVLSNRLCKRMRKFVGGKKSVCCNQLIETALLGSRLSLLQCEHQFKQHQWNCTQQKKALKKILKQDNKESAVLHAFVSAGIVHAVAQSCLDGKIPKCPCKIRKNKRKVKDSPGVKLVSNSRRNVSGYRPLNLITTERSNFKTQVISPPLSSFILKETLRSKMHSKRSMTEITMERRDLECQVNVRYGYGVSRKLLDRKFRKKHKQRDVRTLVMLHNNEAGRRIVLNNLQNICKCHGLSGSCSLKTCSQKLPSLKLIGKEIVEKYNNAIKIAPLNDGKGITAVDSKNKLTKDDLVYLDKSPNFCKRSNQKDSLGTQGRECNGTLKEGFGSCNFLCCGRRYEPKTVKEIQKCKCVFKYCCNVTCQECTVVKEKYFCY